ncbi:MAG: sulfotransferase [Actinomycetota bacterium]
MVKVLSIIGYTRSGSTLLDSVLGQLDGFFSTGELHYLWERGLVQGRRCGCGETLPACPVWTRVRRRAFEGGEPDPRDVMAWQDRCVRTRHTWGLLHGGSGRGVSGAALRAYAPVVRAIYGAIASETGARVVVDSSKRPSDGALTRLLPDIDPYFVHLVRDPRAVVYSWRRRKRELDADDADGGGGGEMPRQGVARSALGWGELNLVSDAVRRAAETGRSLLIRYEDLARAPRAAVEAICDLVGEPSEPTPFDEAGRVLLRPNHTVSGNPSRFSVGAVELRQDEEWRSRMPRGDMVLTTALTAPLLPHFGYPIRPPAPDPGDA